jgi:hypothetical protein
VRGEANAPARSITSIELQRLGHYDLLVVAKAAPKGNRGCNNNGASYQETHGINPPFVSAELNSNLR